MGITILKSGSEIIIDDRLKAELLSDQFKSVFIDEDMSRLPNLVIRVKLKILPSRLFT